MHDSLYRMFVNPNRLLDTAGLRPGKTVLEVGCGPGFFTVPPAEILGEKGQLYTLDINPAAVEHVRQKVSASHLKNVQVMCANATKTGLPDESIDVAFLFGILHSLKDLDSLLLEMHRALKEGGVLAVQKSSWSEKDLLNRFAKGGLFHFSRKDRRIYSFTKEVGSCNLEKTPDRLTIED